MSKERQRRWGMVRFSFAEGILGRLRVGRLLGFGQVREEKKNERLSSEEEMRLWLKESKNIEDQRGRLV